MCRSDSGIPAHPIEAWTGQGRIGEEFLERSLAEPVEAVGVIQVDLVTRLKVANRRW